MRAVPIIVLTASLALGGDLAAARDTRHTQDMRDQAALAKALTGLTPGRPTSCINPANPTLNTHVYGKTILYSAGPNRIWRSETGGGCEGAAHGDIIVQVEHEGRPCSGDILRTIEQSSRIPTGSCSLGQFTPYAKAR